MQTYIGTKIVNASPMNRLDYNVLRGWQLPDDEDGSDESYLVEYVDGGKANVTGYTGYVSWSPKEVFERSYKLHQVTDTGSNPHLGLQPHQQRVVDEGTELNDKLGKLTAFLEKEQPTFISNDEWERLILQRKAMTDYAFILQLRIEHFN